MAHPTNIEGKVTLSDGRTVEFSIGADLGWQQWGANTETLGETVDLMQALAVAADDAGLRPAGEDETRRCPDCCKHPGDVSEVIIDEDEDENEIEVCASCGHVFGKVQA